MDEPVPHPPVRAYVWSMTKALMQSCVSNGGGGRHAAIVNSSVIANARQTTRRARRSAAHTGFGVMAARKATAFTACETGT